MNARPVARLAKMLKNDVRSVLETVQTTIFVLDGVSIRGHAQGKEAIISDKLGQA